MKNSTYKVTSIRLTPEMWQFLRQYGFDRETSAGGAIRLIVGEQMKKEQANAQTERA